MIERKITILERAAEIVFNLMNSRACGLKNENVHLIVLFYYNRFPTSKELTLRTHLGDYILKGIFKNHVYLVTAL